MSTDIPDGGTWASDMAWAEQVDHEMALTHTCSLTERHEITRALVQRGFALPPSDYDEAIADSHRQAEVWSTAHGLEIVSGSAIERRRTKDGVTIIDVGYTFTVTVGKGDIHLDQRTPGVLDTWRWSARFEWWRKVFNRMDGRQGRHLAEVSKIRTTTYDPQHPSVVAPFVGIARAADLGMFADIDGPPSWASGVAFRAPGGDIVRTTEHGIAGPTSTCPGEVVHDGPPPWVRRGMGWDEDDEQTSPMGEGMPPGFAWGGDVL